MLCLHCSRARLRRYCTRFLILHVRQSGMDRLSKAHRSWNMSRIRGRDTSPERQIRSILHGLGYRFRLHVRRLPGKPDIVLPRYQTAIFVNGCFWHRHVGCKFCYEPKSRKSFWREKFEENVKRDKRNYAELKRLGWSVTVIWECQTTNVDLIERRLQRRLERRKRHLL